MMYRFRIAAKKEFLILLNDKTGLALMFIMPILLVYIITIIQDSAFKTANQNSMTLLVANHDNQEAKLFTIVEDSTVKKELISEVLYQEKYLTAIYFPPNFSTQLIQKADRLGGVLLSELGMGDPASLVEKLKIPTVDYYHDPVLQQNYAISIMNMVDAYVQTVEADLLISQMCQRLEIPTAPAKLKQAMESNKIPVQKIAATLNQRSIQPNSTQHNVPAWTIFAMFFMVTSLGNSIVKERLSGAYIRLKTMPTHFSLVLGAKLFVYLVAAILQVTLIFSLAKLTFPSIDLPPLTFPPNMLAFFVVVVLNGLAAVSYATAVGSVARTREQANGFGAVSVVILAALGGIWVPSFILPEFFQTLSYISPLYWCLEGFYTLFLRGGDWQVLAPTLLGLIAFISACMTITYFQLKRDRLI